MKKLLFVLALSLIIFGCHEHEYSDALKAKLAHRKIPESKAKAMKERFKDSGLKPIYYTFDTALYVDLAKHDDEVFIVPVRYSKDDEQEYREAWGIPAGDSAGMVAGYSSFIIQVGTNTNYYTNTKICPPPTGGCSTLAP